MLILLLVIIYIAFISLGLPDSILGSAWPMIHQSLNVPTSYAGISTMIVSCGTIISSFFSAKLIKKFGTGKIVAVSVLMTAVSLLGISFVPDFIWVCVLGIPLGLGAGAVDSALNNFVALHYKAKHMNWLHCFWGIGATTGPFIMSIFLLRKNGWRMGYATIGIIQLTLTACLIISLPLWKKFETTNNQAESVKSDIKLSTIIRIPGAVPAFIGFFCYCALELTTGLWGSSYLVICKGLQAGRAAQWVSLYYLGITTGRFISGFMAIKFNDKNMIRIGQVICICGAILLLIPASAYFQLAGLVTIGLGCAPIYPAMLHETPNRFGKELSLGIMGIQMAVAYVGSTFMPPLFGFIANTFNFNILPYFQLAIVAIMLIISERVNNIVRINRTINSNAA